MREHSDYHCYYFIDIGKKDLVQISNTACWAGIRDPKDYYYYSNTKIDHWGSRERVHYKESIPYIYIDFFRTKHNSLINTKVLLKFINEITECKIVTINKKSYIKYKLINDNHYYSNLVLLNFIRMIWYKPPLFNHEQFFKDIRKKDITIEDALYFLMDMTKINVLPPGRGYANYLDHSLITPGIIPKHSKLLFEYRGERMDQFLIQKIE